MASPLVPDISTALAGLSKTFGTPETRAADRLELQQKQQLADAFSVFSGGNIIDPKTANQTSSTVANLPSTVTPYNPSTKSTADEQEQALIRITQLAGPNVANSIRATLERADKAELEAMNRMTEKAAKTAFLVENQPTFAGKQRVLREEAAKAQARGEDISRFVELSNMTEEQLGIELQKMQIEAADIKDLTTAKLKEKNIAEIVKGSDISEGGFVVTRNPDGSFTKTKVLDVSSTTGPGGKASAVTKIYDNGTSIQALPNGKVVVKDPAGNEVQGEARLQVLKDARQEEIDFTGEKKSAEVTAQKTFEQGEKAYENVQKIRDNIANYNDAIQALDDGAETGPIMSKLPSFRAASVRLDNLQKRLGLDVISNVTFGALSEKELQTALDTALPTNLDEPELRQWLVEKRDAQEKLASYIEDAAIYLMTPGNSIQGWMESQKALKSQQPESQTDVTQMSDDELFAN